VVSSAEWQDLLRRAGERLVELDAQWLNPSGSSAWISTRLAPVRAAPGHDGHNGHDGRCVGTVGIVHDVTAEHHIAELREEYAAVIAHDLRSPINAISLSLQSALRRRVGADDAVQLPAESLDRMSRTAKRIDDMVGELLDAARVEQGKLQLSCAPVDLGQLVAELVDEMRPNFPGHDVALDLPPHPVAVSIDRLRISKVVANLLENAAKYSRPGSTIRAALHERDGGVELTVADEGEGIAPEDVRRLFDRFFQARKAREHKATGAGLGLYIAKGIVDAHGGRLSVESAPGVGSTFFVWLPR
jgi:signal transduction histidine kinase